MSDHSYQAYRASGMEQENGVTRAVDRSMPTAKGQLPPGRLRPSSVVIGGGAVGAAMPMWARRSSAGGWRPSAIPAGREVRATEDWGAPEPDDEFRSSSNGGGSGSSAPAPPPPPVVAPKGPSASLTLSGDTYTDTATESRKNIKFNATWSGGIKEDYIIVQWLKGYMKNSKGKPYKETMYGKTTSIDYADWQIDSVDEDPAYRSDASGRWKYAVDGPVKFSATDSPGPMYTSDGVGAEAKLDFKVAVYKSADVPTKTTGTITATALSSFQPWSYHVGVQGGGKFKH